MHIKFRIPVFIVLLATAFLLFNVACASTSSNPPATAKSAQTPEAKRLTTADLQKLRWIEGTWRGTGEVQAAFFERYKFENDTTLSVETFENEKLDKVTDVTRYELKDGQFGGGSEGSRSIATSIDDRSITFDPVSKGRNSFRFERESENSWKATLTLPATANKPAQVTIYKMERFASPGIR